MDIATYRLNQPRGRFIKNIQIQVFTEILDGTDSVDAGVIPTRQVNTKTQNIKKKITGSIS